MSSRFLFITCTNFTYEMNGALGKLELPEGCAASAGYFPADCNCRRISPNTLKEAAPETSSVQAVCLVPAPCLGTRPPAASCLEQIVDEQAITAAASSRTYLATAGWLGRWQNQLRGWGFGKDDAASFFGEFADRVTVLDMWGAAGLDRLADEFSEFISLPVTIQPVSPSRYLAKLKSLAMAAA